MSLRRYQESIIARAIEENTLVVLPTGLGKTIIAAMVAAHRLQEHPKSKVLFLAPTKPLVEQHMRTFGELLNVEDMCVLTGEDPPQKRREMWDGSRIVFATPQTVENDLIRGLDLKDVSLLIFDEAHRGCGGYSYVTIAEQYVKAASNRLILGLTASPSSVSEKVKEICGNLHIRRVEAKTDLDADVRPYIQDVKVRWVHVELPDDFKAVHKLLKDVMRENIGKLKELGYVESSDLSKTGKRALLGLQRVISGEIASGVDAYQAASTVAAAIKVDHAIELLETQGISALDEYFKRLRAQNSRAVKRLMRDHNVLKAMTTVSKMRGEGIEHPKVGELVRIVGGYRGRKVLVFTQYRDSVETIIDRLNAADILAHKFIGQAARGVKEGMTQRRQVEVLEKFKGGAYTALVATSVAEEGLDIPKVDAVVFYEPVPSEIRTIQRRGRTGRSAAGEVYVLITKGTRDEGYYWASVHKERRMGAIVRQMRKGMGEEKGMVEYEVKAVGEPATPQPDVAFGQQSLLSYGPGEGGRLKVIVDVRERNSTIISALKAGCEIELRQLPVGDYLLSDRVCVERKTVGDFLQSIVDRRLLAQLAEMRRNFQTPVLVIEGPGSLYSQRNIHPNAVRGAVASAAVDFGVPVIRTESEEDTAQMLLAIARREQEEEGRPVALRGEKKPELLSERQRFVVESLPNVSAVLARRLLERFGSVEAVAKASEKKLCEVEGIGEKKASEIRRVVKSRYGK